MASGNASIAGKVNGRVNEIMDFLMKQIAPGALDNMGRMVDAIGRLLSQISINTGPSTGYNVFPSSALGNTLSSGEYDSTNTWDFSSTSIDSVDIHLFDKDAIVSFGISSQGSYGPDIYLRGGAVYTFRLNARGVRIKSAQTLNVSSYQIVAMLSGRGQ